jgi:hypothetical protein
MEWAPAHCLRHVRRERLDSFKTLLRAVRPGGVCDVRKAVLLQQFVGAARDGVIPGNFS